MDRFFIPLLLAVMALFAFSVIRGSIPPSTSPSTGPWDNPIAYAVKYGDKYHTNIPNITLHHCPLTFTGVFVDDNTKCLTKIQKDANPGWLYQWLVARDKSAQKERILGKTGK